MMEKSLGFPEDGDVETTLSPLAFGISQPNVPEIFNQRMKLFDDNIVFIVAVDSMPSLNANINNLNLTSSSTTLVAYFKNMCFWNL